MNGRFFLFVVFFHSLIFFFEVGFELDSSSQIYNLRYDTFGLWSDILKFIGAIETDIERGVNIFFIGELILIVL
jgi:hypothetical protein